MSIFDNLLATAMMGEGGGGGGGDEIITTLQNIPNGTATVTMSDDGAGGGIGYADWFVPAFTTMYPYVDSLTITSGDETITVENANITLIELSFENFYIWTEVTSLPDEKVVWGIGSSSIISGDITISWSLANIYTASPETRAFFPDLFSHDGGGEDS